MGAGTRPSVALCVICHDRPDRLREALDSAEDDGWDEILVVDMASTPPLVPDARVRWMRSEENLGVAGGRNLLAEEAHSDILVFLDDDAVFLTPVVDRAAGRFRSEPKLAVVAFAIQRRGGEVRSAETPFRGRHVDAATPRPTAYFLGGAHAMRRSAMRAVGGYDERFFYDGEETDLSFALLRDGWTLWFDPAVRVEHRPSSRGRVTDPRVAALTWRNRWLIARRHLPWPVAAVHLGVWAIRSGAMASRAGDLRPWLQAWRDGARLPVVRRPLPWTVLLKAHRAGGRVVY